MKAAYSTSCFFPFSNILLHLFLCLFNHFWKSCCQQAGKSFCPSWRKLSDLLAIIAVGIVNGKWFLFLFRGSFNGF